MSHPTWAVAALVDEPAVLVVAFARHHLAIGASEVHLFLDRPNPEAENLLQGLAGCHITVCDEAFWERENSGRRPVRHTGRQRFVATRTYRQTTCDWLLHCDADEFVADGEALRKALAKADRNKGLILRNRERAYRANDRGLSLFEGGFRSPVNFAADDAEAFYDDLAAFLNAGLTGHRVGKSISPTGRGWEIGVHHPKHADARHETVDLGRAPGRLLLHFDGMTPLHYALKLFRKSFENYPGPKRKLGSAREAQMSFVQAHQKRPQDVLEMVKRLQSVTPLQEVALSALNAFDPTPFVPQNCDDLDLTRASFDADLDTHEAALLAKAGLKI